jgi:pimeloyl-ACP methyl ester carboxylesterase
MLRHHVLSIILICLVSILTLSACAPNHPPEPVEAPRHTIVFVHGAWGGGWQFHKVEPLLEQAGYRVLRPTMTGLGERVHLAGPEVGLSTHIEDIVNVLEFEDLHDIVLVGHSYGGMVITGVADRVPDRITQLIYLDAILPENGESVASLFGDAIDTMATVGKDGAEPWQLVPLWVKPGKLPPVDVPQPLLTFTEPIDLEKPAGADVPGAFILTVEEGKETDDFDAFAERARARGWPVVQMTGTHNPQWYQPEAFVEVLLETGSKGSKVE